MKKVFHHIDRSLRILLASALLPVALSAVGAGCASSHNAEVADPDAQVTVLNESLAALKREFNADTSKPRLLAIFSPTCGGCIYGAKALQHEVQSHPDIGQRARILIVWVAMLPSDNEAEAKSAVRRFDVAGAHHFYDEQKWVGRHLMAEQFPNALNDALQTLPSDSPLRQTLEARKESVPEPIRLWDTVLVFPPGVKWEERSPAPAWWTKQTGFSGEETPGQPTALFWKNSTRQPPVRSDWYLEAREALRVVARLAGGSSQR